MDVVLARQLRARRTAAHGVPPGGRPAGRALSTLEPFDVLLERDLPSYPLPRALEAIYGRIGFSERALYSNFVSSLDGLATLGATPSAGSVISGRNPADRFLMGLLRACADAVLVGAGTLRATPGHHWTAEHIFPALAAEFGELRRALGRAPKPHLVVLTASGHVDTSHPALADGATIVTTPGGAAALRGSPPPSAGVLELPVVDVSKVIATMRGRGYDVLLTEGGPHLMGELVKANLLEEAFITLSPVLAGEDGDERLGMIAGVELLPERGMWARLLSVRRHGDFVFLRYGLRAIA